jgi:hypothetical protein
LPEFQYAGFSIVSSVDAETGAAGRQSHSLLGARRNSDAWKAKMVDISITFAPHIG